MAIDRADWHWDSAEEFFRKNCNITGELTDEQEENIWLFAGNHIGLFLRWIIEHGFEGEDVDEEECGKVRSGQMSGTEYLLKNCDGKLWDEDIREDILPFVEFYYNGDNYFNDYGSCCIADDKPCYGVISGEEDYQRLRSKIDIAYEQFSKNKNLST